jgi:hypothetical protein
LMPIEPPSAVKVFSISADSFVENLRETIRGGDFQLSIPEVDAVRIEVAGTVNLTAKKFPRGLLVERVHFRDAVKMNNCVFGNEGCFKSCTFDHSIDLTNAILRNGISFIDCTCGTEGSDLSSSKIIMDDAEIRGDIALLRTTVYGCLLARRLRLSGNVAFTACTIDARSVFSAPLDLSNSTIRGSVTFEMGQLSTAARPSHTDASTTFRAIAGTAVGSTPTPRLPRSTFIDRNRTVSFTLRGAEVTEVVNLSCAVFIGDADLSNVKCRGLGSQAGFYAQAQGPSAQPIADQNTVAANENFGGAVIEGSLTLSGGDLGLIHLHGISISGEMMLIDGCSGQITLEDSICDGRDGGHHFVATGQLGNFIMARWRCRDFVYLHLANITGVPNAFGVHGIIIKSSEINRGVSFWPGREIERRLQTYMEQSIPFSDLRFFTLTADGKLSQGEAGEIMNRWRRRLSVRGNINVDHCIIGDDLDLTGVVVGGDADLGGGKIEILDSKIDGDVVFRSPITFLDDLQASAPLLRLLARHLIIVGSEHDSAQTRDQALPSPENRGMNEETSTLVATCDAVDMRGLKANNVDLTGLHLLRPPQGRSRTRGDGDLARTPENSLSARSIDGPASARLSYLEVYGKVMTFARFAKSAEKNISDDIKALKRESGGEILEPRYPPGPQPKNWERELSDICFGSKAPAMRQQVRHLEARAKIPGALDFQHAKIGELIISGASFRDESAGGDATKNGIVLDYAEISKLYVARSELPEVEARARHHNGFPVPVSLTDLSVKSWFLEDTGDPGSLQDGEAYIKRETTIADPYLDLLDNDRVFRMSSYLAIEKSLRDRGLTTEARRIFVAGNYRDVRTESEKQPVKSDTQNRLSSLRSKLRWKIWRPGDGRYRQSILAEASRVQDRKRDPLALGLCAIGCAAFFFATLGIIAWRSFASFGWLLPVAFYLFALHGNVFRLERPLREYLGFVLSAAWCIAVFYLVVGILVRPYQSKLVDLSILLLLLLCLFPLLGAMRCFVDQLYWSLVDYGTSALRLAGVIFVLMALSFAFVSSERENFTPTLLAELEAKNNGLALLADENSGKTAQKSPLVHGKSAHSPKSRWDHGGIPSKESWVFGERLWMTFRYHVPVVGAIISEEWQPSNRPLSISGMVIHAGRRSPDWWPYDAYWPRARDWYGLMLWLNWILWPLFLPFLIHSLWRER